MWVYDRLFLGELIINRNWFYFGVTKFLFSPVRSKNKEKFGLNLYGRNAYKYSEMKLHMQGAWGAIWLCFHMLLFDLYLFKVLCITPYLFCLRKITRMHVGLSQDRQWVIYLVCQAQSIIPLSKPKCFLYFGLQTSPTHFKQKKMSYTHCRYFNKG